MHTGLLSGFALLALYVLASRTFGALSLGAATTGVLLLVAVWEKPGAAPAGKAARRCDIVRILLTDHAGM